MPVVSVSIPDELLSRIDEFSGRHGYSGRSELMREASRSLLDEFENQSLEGRRLVATVTAVFDQTGVEKTMIDLRHQYEGLIQSNVHSHIAEHYCMELFVVEASYAEVKDFVAELRSTGDVLDINYTVTPLDKLSN
ncbi:MAG: CopG family ribbon-helix-helix protein [Halobacteria archaeon]